MGQAYNKGELVKIFNNEGGHEFSKACDYIAGLVPEKLWIDNLLYSHMACHYDADSECFFYVQMITGKTRLLTKQEVDRYKTRTSQV